MLLSSFPSHNDPESESNPSCTGSDTFPVVFQEVFTEMEEKYGEVEEMNVCDNLGDHLVGNVYVKVGDPFGSGAGPAGAAVE